MTSAHVSESRCARCEQVKPSFEFYKGPNKNGLSSWCKECAKASAKASAARFRAEAQDASRTWDARHEPGRCQGVLNVGLGTRYFGIRCTRKATAGGYCLTHADRKTREVARTLRPILNGEVPFGGAAFRERIERERQELLDAVAAGDDELAGLLHEQQRESRWGHLVGTRPWLVSLDAPRFDEGDWYEFLGYGGRWLKSYTTDSWTDVVIALVDRKREIARYADAA